MRTLGGCLHGGWKRLTSEVAVAQQQHAAVSAQHRAVACSLASTAVALTCLAALALSGCGRSSAVVEK
jgi:hypothetical protein